jgi:N utilization substance protein B
MALERREHRIALEVLYAVDIGKASVDDALKQAHDGVGVFGRGDEAAAEDPYEPAMPAIDRRADTPRSTDWALVEALVRGTWAHRTELEAQISPLLDRWTIDRLSGIDRLIIDLAAWELRYRSDVPTSVIINHAVELARRLSTERSGDFVNGVLDSFAKTPPAGLGS